MGRVPRGFGRWDTSLQDFSVGVWTMSLVRGSARGILRGGSVCVADGVSGGCGSMVIGVCKEQGGGRWGREGMGERSWRVCVSMSLSGMSVSKSGQVLSTEESR